MVKREKENRTLVNEKITSESVFVVDKGSDGTPIGKMRLFDAIEAAKSRGMDVVKISDGRDGLPVCRIIDYGRFKYEEAKKQKNRPAQTVSLKEIKLRPVTDTNDFNIKVGQARRFFAEGHKVQLNLRFKRREMAHQELGMDMFNRFAEAVSDVARIDRQAKSAGMSINMVLAPLGKTNKRENNEK